MSDKTELLDHAAAKAVERAALRPLDGLRARATQQLGRADFVRLLTALHDSVGLAARYLDEHITAAAAEALPEGPSPVAAIDHAAVMQQFVAEHPAMAADTVLIAVYLLAGRAVVQVEQPQTPIPDAPPAGQ